ncbi:MAG TPA: serine hydrolase, partial [Ktedonobacteraceae bacterium]|nr:serine hydrolase [Ktedonobacteraceae bacterium]
MVKDVLRVFPHLFHILTVTWGTRYRPFGRRDPEALEGCVREELPHLPLVALPGKVHSYSNPGLILVGYVAQVVSGKAFAVMMSEEVFGPLNMQRTTFDPVVALTYPMAQTHRRPDGKTLQVWHRFFDNSGHAPSGYAFSTVLDLANFAIMQT